jgi:pyruvate/2-oxoglutarate dehydrogenase complex dihydrolipoamide dehydrogenase (E3) component
MQAQERRSSGGIDHEVEVDGHGRQAGAARTRTSTGTGQNTASELPRVVIVGVGFGGLQAARAWRTIPVEVTVVDRSNHHVFHPLVM